MRAIVPILIIALTVVGCGRTTSLQSAVLPDRYQEHPSEIIPHDACSTNMMGIFLELLKAVGPSGDKFPPSLASLSYFTNYALFVCPTTGHVPGTMSNVEEWTDYIYVSGGNQGTMCNVALLISPPENHGGKFGYVLWGYDYVVQLPTDQVRALIKEPWCLKIQGQGWDEFVKPEIKVHIPARFASIYGTNQTTATRP
jgi:hypothetical protein